MKAFLFGACTVAMAALLLVGCGVQDAAAAYQSIEDAAVSGYQAVEDAVVGTYEKIEDAFTDKYLQPEDIEGNP